ncbi:MAG: type II secretion system F family protein [Eubacteriales bacterium]|nr:type II secretion system F family protein [Eubacteriales bacterium]
MGWSPLEFIRDERRGLFYRPAKWLWKKQEKFAKRHPAQRTADEGRNALAQLYGEAQAKAYYEKFRIRKNEKLMVIFLTGMGLSAILAAAAWLSGKGNGVTALERPKKQDGSRQYELKARTGEETLTGISVEIPACRLTQKEQEELLEKAAFQLDELAESWGLDAVTEDISLPDTLQDGLVEVRFESSLYDLMDNSGHVRNELTAEEGEILTLRAVLVCETKQKELVYPVRVLPKGQDIASRLERETKRQVLEQESQEETGVILLPEEFDGRTISWELAEPAYCGWIAVLTMAGCIVLSVAFEKDLLKEGEKRREELLFSYPAFLTRLTLLAGSGMPIRLVFGRMAKEAGREGAPPVYEEVLRTCREMESGLTELQAYENFGKRCRLPQYKKCASLLVQNVRRGTGGLLAALNQEAENAFEERKALARRKGEEAQTRMLLPMLMMLVVVMILIMVPACLSFGGM